MSRVHDPERSVQNQGVGGVVSDGNQDTVLVDVDVLNDGETRGRCWCVPSSSVDRSRDNIPTPLTPSRSGSYSPDICQLKTILNLELWRGYGVKKGEM